MEPLATTSSAAIQSIFDEVTDDEVENENENENEHKIIPSPVISNIVKIEKGEYDDSTDEEDSDLMAAAWSVSPDKNIRVQDEDRKQRRRTKRGVYVRRNPAWRHIFFTKKNPLIQ